MNELTIGQRTNISWDVPHGDTYRGHVVATDKIGVVVEFDVEPGAGLRKRQRFTRRKDGRLIAARWHWAVGVPVLVPDPANV